MKSYLNAENKYYDVDTKWNVLTMSDHFWHFVLTIYYATTMPIRNYKKLEAVQNQVFNGFTGMHTMRI